MLVITTGRQKLKGTDLGRPPNDRLFTPSRLVRQLSYFHGVCQSILERRLAKQSRASHRLAY